MFCSQSKTNTQNNCNEHSTNNCDHEQRIKNRSQGVLETSQCKFDDILELVRDLQGRVLACEPRSRQARWLWRSGNFYRGGWLPWEFEALNSSPELFIWHREHPSRITTTHAGLYRISLGVFTHNRATIQLCIQGEATLTLEPQDASFSCSSQDTPAGSLARQGFTKSEGTSMGRPYVTRRAPHTAGQICCLSIDEFFALPAPCDIAIKLDLGPEPKDSTSQAFLAVTKI